MICQPGKVAERKKNPEVHKILKFINTVMQTVFKSYVLH